MYQIEIDKQATFWRPVLLFKTTTPITGVFAVLYYALPFILGEHNKTIAELNA